jgi:hypothetical protein
MKRYKSHLLMVTVFVVTTGTAYGEQPPNVVASDDNANTAMGTGALLHLPAALGAESSNNTAAGYTALTSNTVGGFNTAVGAYALTHNTEGYDNTALGFSALTINTTGYGNTACGDAALFSNTTGYYNTASGDSALHNNHTGSYNSASGHFALANNETGTNNTASGALALFVNYTGVYNTATGSSAMQSNFSGSYNTAVGVNALFTNQGGSNNIAIGANAGYYIRGSRYNIDIGNVGNQMDVGLIRIGTPGQQTAAYIAGVTNTHVTGSAVYISSTGQLGVLASSERYKTAVAPMGDSTEKLRELRPVTFHLRTDPTRTVQYGLIAEEVAKVYPELVIRDEAGKIQGVRYEELAPMLLNEAQQQRQDISQLKQQLEQLQAALLRLQAKDEFVAQR